MALWGAGIGAGRASGGVTGLADDRQRDLGHPDQRQRLAVFVQILDRLKIEPDAFAKFFHRCPGAPHHVLVQRRWLSGFRPLLVEQLRQPDGIPPGAVFTANRPQKRLEQHHVARLVAGV